MDTGYECRRITYLKTSPAFDKDKRIGNTKKKPLWNTREAYKYF